MSTPTKQWFPVTHDDAVQMAKSIRAMSGTYDTTSAASIVAAIRSGNINKIPNGSVFVEHHAVYGDIYFVTRAKNQHKVAGDNDRPTITIQPMYLLSANGGSTVATFQYDRKEAFVKVAEAIPANTVCKFTAIAYGGWTAGTYHFTATEQITAGSLLGIDKEQNTALTSCKVNVFANAKSTSASASYSIASGDGDATVNLGAWGTDCNHPQRVSYGSNNEEQSNFFQFLNADTGANYMDSVWVAKTDWDMMDTSFTSKKGFLGGFSDEFRSYLGLCAIPNITNQVYETNGYTADGKKYTHNGYFFLPSRKEVYGTTETTYEGDEVQFDYYKDIATSNADKLMYAHGATSPTTYWLRTPHASYAGNVRICYTGYGGALSSSSAINALGAAPLAILA
ncbi:MAG: hypothetical protein IKR48_02670 [Kiritimatiellae bacterium]|nr:hypothetical protein [Kiritimatiellia bacterium]